ncbi:MAG: TonB-dependent receptor [Gemmatimonadota bacterium]
MRACGTLLLCSVLTTPALGQATAAPVSAPAATALALTGTVTGRVLDALTGEPVAHAVVVLEPFTEGLMLTVADGAVRYRSQLTGESGAYRFGDVVAGTYRLRAERIGYRAVSVTIAVRRPAEADVSVAMESEPVLLEPVRVEQRAHAFVMAAAGSGGSSADADAARVSAERVRQALFVAPDTRVLTYDDVVDGVTLGEGDVFRALQRFPGVGTRDDYSAELWSRGAPWPHTRVTFDGVPLFNPLHAVGLLSAIAPDVLGAVFFHPGVRPPAVPGGAAAVVELRTRPGGGDGELRGSADVSLASAKLALEQHVAGRGSWLVAARRSHLAALQGGLGSLGLDTVDLPFRFHDVAGRADVQLGGSSRIEASGLWEEDRLHGDLAGVLERTDARWGNTAGRVTLRTELLGLELSQSVGASRFSVRTDARQIRTRDPAPAWTEPAGSNRIGHTLLAGELAPTMKGEVASWSVGYDVAWMDVDYDGPLPRTHAVEPDTLRQLLYARSLRVLGVHGDVRFSTAGDRLTINPGLRLEAVQNLGGHGRVADGGAGSGQRLRPAPRIAVRYAISDSHTISAAAGRSWQHAQALGLAGPSVHPAFHASHFWLWSDATTPALRADIASIGTERWLGDGWLVAATLFARHASGLTVPDPEPGRLGGRPLYVTGEGRARGMELSARRIGARWSTSLGYTAGRSDVEAAGYTYPSSADRHQIVDAMGAVQLPAGLRLAVAFTAMSGAPFTRAYARLTADCDDFGFGCDNPNGSWIEAPNAERTPAYRSLDASLHWTRTIGRGELGAYVQVRNLLDRDNASTYAGSAPIGRIETRDGSEIVWDDRFESGLPRLPLAGVRVSFR